MTARTIALSGLLLGLTLGGLRWMQSAALTWEDGRHYERPVIYRVSSATNLAGPWEHVATLPSAPTSGTMTVLLPVVISTNEPARFYRVARFFNFDRADDPLHNIHLMP